MKPADEEKLRELAHTTVAAAGVGLDLEEVIIVAAGRRRLIRVIVDGDDGVNLDAAAAVSRALAAALDDAGDGFLGPDPYTLEVTSPGVGRPLTDERHFRRARGRLVTVKLLDGSTVEGRVRRATESAVELLTGTDASTVSVPMADIRRGRVEIEFGRPPAAHAALLEADGFVDPARAFDDPHAATNADVDGDAEPDADDEEDADEEAWPEESDDEDSDEDDSSPPASENRVQNPAAARVAAQEAQR